MLRTAFLIPWIWAPLAAQNELRLEFFETRVRPLLAERCHGCHGPTKQKSDLRLDHIDTILTGGERGPALVRGKPEESRMITAVSYSDEALQMPPKKRLSPADIEILRMWIRMGAPWPDEPRPDSRAPEKPLFDLEKRKREHWAWQPLRAAQPPEVADKEWSANPIDRFVRAKLQKAGLTPAPVADRATLLRRVTFDLTGLPPTVAEREAFLADDTLKAYPTVVDRLLASPHFGEHWGRHWLDLVRYAETLGHEYDYELPNAWRYRDYVIRAFNADVPYDQFVREHIAGDLLETQRRHETSVIDESTIGTAFYWFAEQGHSPVDVRQQTSDRMHNQIDVLSKTFLALTVGCARCHDHKFDAISTADYYALRGFLKSSRYVQRDVAPPLSVSQLLHIHTAQEKLAAAWNTHVQAGATSIEPYLSAIGGGPRKGLDEVRLEKWDQAFRDKSVRRDPLHPLRGFVLLEKAKRERRGDVRVDWQRLTAPARNAARDFDAKGVSQFADFRRDDYTGWFRGGSAFGDAPVREQIVVNRTPIAGGGWAFSAADGRGAQGVLHSPTFRIAKKYIHVLAFGQQGRIDIVLEGFNVIRAPIYGQLRQIVNNTRPRWYTVDVGMWLGEQAYIEFCDQTAPGLSANRSYPADSYIGVQRIVFADSRRTPKRLAELPARILGDARSPLRTLEDLAGRYAEAMRRASDALAAGTLDAEQAHLLYWFEAMGLLGTESAELRRLRKEVRDSGTRVRKPLLVPAMADGTGEDQNIFIHGGHRNLGELVPRRMLTALGGEPLKNAVGSGRLHLANQLLAASNPLPARVLVNRLWHHLFGRGIVATVDNFGVQGDEPSHPALLDWLARRFVADNWSIKRAIRRTALSRTYRMASNVGAPAAEKRDPDLRLLHRMPVRRLTAESIRDAILATSGRLDRKQYGKGVFVNLTRFMTGGRGKPRSGPIDGAGRRSIYLRVRRNFLSPFLLAFDMPLPTSTFGRRDVTNVPAQALALLNDPFVKGEAKRWASRVERTVSDTNGSGTDARIRLLYKEAFARSPRPDELRRVRDFLQTRSLEDLCHALFNVKEFVFLR